MEISKDAAAIQIIFKSTSEDENAVTRHINKIKLSIVNEDLLPWKFNLENLSEEGYCCSIVNRKVGLDTVQVSHDDKSDKLPFGMTFALEQTDLLTSDKGQRRSTYTLFIRGSNPAGEGGENASARKTLFGKALTNVECGCEKQEVTDGSSYSPTKMFELDETVPFAVCTFKHSTTAKCGAITINMDLEFFDFSKAVSTPFEVQEIIAKRDCLTDSTNLLTTWLTPFDITIHCNDGYKIRAHKAILAARSPVFFRMFGGKDKKVKIEEDVQYATMEVILHFIYSGSLHRYWKYQPEEVLEAASNYELSQLIQFFDSLLPQICTNDNAMKLLRLAEEHELTNAHKQIYSYIKKNFKEVFTKTVCFDWK